MGIPYDPTKPAAADKPANDQPIMQSNFSSIKTLIDVDHVDFSSSYYGQHNQIRFAANNVPSLPTALDNGGNRQGILFTNTTSGSVNVNQLFYYAGSAAQSSNQYVISGSGSVMVMAGIIIKWGVFTMTNPATSLVVSFASAFPNNCFSVVVSNTTGNGTDVIGISAGPSTSSFTALRSNGTLTVNYYYTAIGN